MSAAEAWASLPWMAPLAEAHARIGADRERGASALAREAAEAIARAADAAQGVESVAVSGRVAALRAGCIALASVRPTMVAIGNTVAGAWARATSDAAPDDAQFLLALRTSAGALGDAWKAAAAAIVEASAPVVRGVVLTHSRSGTVESVLRAGYAAGRVARVLATRSLPGDEGTALVRALAADGVPCELLSDAAVVAACAKADVALVGADAVLMGGDVVNKIGTHLVALAAREAGVPLYAACESLKVSAEGHVPPLDERGDDAGVALPPGVAYHDPLFERTPGSLFTGIITERGRLDGAGLTAIAREHAEARRSLFGG